MKGAGGREDGQVNWFEACAVVNLVRGQLDPGSDKRKESSECSASTPAEQRPSDALGSPRLS